MKPSPRTPIRGPVLDSRVRGNDGATPITPSLQDPMRRTARGTLFLATALVQSLFFTAPGLSTADLSLPAGGIYRYRHVSETSYAQQICDPFDFPVKYVNFDLTQR